MQDQIEESSTTVFPVHMFKVSREWIDILFNEIKKSVMTKAIAANCDKNFLGLLNEMELVITDDAKVNVKFGKALVMADSNLSTVASDATAQDAPKEETPAS